MAPDAQLTDVERRLRDLRGEGGVTRADVVALLDSADPVDRQAGVKAVALTATGEFDCFADDLPSLAPYLADDSPDVRFVALQAVVELVGDRDEVLADVPAVANRLDDESTRVAELALDAVLAVAGEAPDTVADAAPDVAAFLDHDRSPVRRSAVHFFEQVVETAPAAVVPVAPSLAACLGDTYESPDLQGEAWQTTLSDSRTRQDVVSHTHAERERHRTIRETATRVLVALARARPDAVAAEADPIRGHLDAADPHVQQCALTVLAALGERRPGEVSRAVETVCACLGGEDTEERTAAAVGALGIAVDDAPDRIVEAVRPHVAVLVDCLDHDDPHVRGAAVGVLSYVAERDPDAVSAATADVAALLEDDHEFVRGNAALTLGSLSPDAAVPALRDRRADEPDDDVRAFIDAALDRLGESPGGTADID